MAKKLSQKLAAPAASQHAPAVNPETQAKIDAFRADNPKYVEYLGGLSRERLENLAILRKIEQAAQKDRFAQATSQKLDTWLAARPDVAQQIAEKVSKIAPEKQVGARINMIRYAIEKEALNATQPGTKVSV
jgi:hypothetical protein